MIVTVMRAAPDSRRSCVLSDGPPKIGVFKEIDRPGSRITHPEQSVRLRTRPRRDRKWCSRRLARFGGSADNLRRQLADTARAGSGSALESQIEWPVTWPEDRATRRRDPSAAPGTKTGDGTLIGVPFLFCLSGIGTKAINLGGPGGQSPPALASTGDWVLEISFVVWVWLLATPVRIAVHCLRVRSQSFFSSGMPALPLKQGDSRTRLHP